MIFEDRIQALKRSSKYIRDYNKYNEYRKKNRLVDSYIIDYIAPVCIVSPQGQKLCKKYGIPYPFNPENPFNIPAVEPKPVRKKRSGEHIYGLKDARFLDVTIDLSRNLKDINKSIKVQYHYWKDQIKIGEGNKSTKLNHWKIYDLAQRHSLLQITKDLFHIKSNPAYSTKAMKYYGQVRRAFKKAERMIQEFER